MLAAGMLVVSTWHCEILEVMGQKLTCCLGQERDPVTLANCIKSLLMNPENWKQYADYRRNQVSIEYDIDRQLLKLVDIYKDLVETI